jgi:hypothetical protein
MMALLEAEFVNADDLHFVKRDFPIKVPQPFLMNVLDQVPAYSKKFGNRPDRPEFEQIEYRQGKRSNKAVRSDHEWKCRPPQGRTVAALDTVEDKIQQTLLAPDRAHLEPPSLLSLEDRSPAAAMRTSENLFSHLGAENQGVSKEARCSELNPLQPKSMAKYRRGHGSWLLRNVRLASNKTDAPCHVHFLFSKTTQVRVCRKTQNFALNGMSTATFR